MRMKKVLPRTG
ncbi:unnamed protein product [Coregonus sp. 'balchen']|nr:unnamed protein product [Coregonus sp. 'balchen']